MYKPVTPQGLRAKIRELLEAADTRPEVGEALQEHVNALRG
jgi:hypothetical protein